MAKKKPSAKPRVASKSPAQPKEQEPAAPNDQQDEMLAEAVMLAETAAQISPMDCAGFSVMTFNDGEPPEEWRAPGLEAMRKFMLFGWTAYHAFGGLNIDWDAYSQKIIQAMRKAPRKTTAPKRARKPKPS